MKNCLTCKKEFKPMKGNLKKRACNFCSLKCYWIDKKLHTGKETGNWKGDGVGYSGVHMWIRQWKGDPKQCEKCGTVSAKKYEWANIDHKYRRILDDYIRMCTSCHRKYDIINNNYKTK